MIRSVDFISRAQAEVLPGRDDLAIISIAEPEGVPATLAIPEGRILRLAFHDVNPEHAADARWRLFDPLLGGQIVEFLQRVHGTPEAVDLICHCRAGISRSAAVALFAAEMTGCEFPRRPFAGLANKHVLAVLSEQTGHFPVRPRALPRREEFVVALSRNFQTGEVEVSVENRRTGELVVLVGPMLKATALAAEGIERVSGVRNPPPSYHVADWDSLAP